MFKIFDEFAPILLLSFLMGPTKKIIADSVKGGKFSLVAIVTKMVRVCRKKAKFSRKVTYLVKEILGTDFRIKRFIDIKNETTIWNFDWTCLRLLDIGDFLLVPDVNVITLKSQIIAENSLTTSDNLVSISPTFYEHLFWRQNILLLKNCIVKL